MERASAFRRRFLAPPRRISLCVAVAIAGAGTLAATPSRAVSPPDANGRALSLYQESTRAYDEGRFQDAVKLLLEAYSFRPEPVILFNLARAYEGLGDLPRAIESYGRYLERDPQASDRRSIEQRLATLQKQVDERAALELQRDEERKRGEQARRAAAEALARASREVPPPARPRALPWLVAGAGLAGLGTGVVLGVLSRNHYDDAVADAYRGPATVDYAAARSYAMAANVAFGVGAAVAAAGVVWGVVDLLSLRTGPGPKPSALVVGPLPGGAFAGAGGRF